MEDVDLDTSRWAEELGCGLSDPLFFHLESSMSTYECSYVWLCMRKEWWADHNVLNQADSQESNTVVIQGSFSMSTKGCFPSGCIISYLSIYIPDNKMDIVFWDAGQQIIKLIIRWTSKNPCYAQATWDWICLKKKKINEKNKKSKTKKAKQNKNKQTNKKFRIKVPTWTFPTTSKRFQIKITDKQTA